MRQGVTDEVIVGAVRWQLMFPVSYRGLQSMLADRGVDLAHTTLHRWIPISAPGFEQRVRPHLWPSDSSWQIDEIFVWDRGPQMGLWRVGDRRNQKSNFPRGSCRVSPYDRPWCMGRPIGPPRVR